MWRALSHTDNYQEADAIMTSNTSSKESIQAMFQNMSVLRSYARRSILLEEELEEHEEIDRHLTIIDVTDLENPEVVSKFGTRPNVSVHNVEVVDGIAYVSYYIGGLRVVDLRDPENPKEIAHFDTVAAEDERGIMGQGAFGVHVVGDTVFLSDMQSGTYAFKVEVEDAE